MHDLIFGDVGSGIKITSEVTFDYNGAGIEIISDVTFDKGGPDTSFSSPWAIIKFIRERNIIEKNN